MVAGDRAIPQSRSWEHNPTLDAAIAYAERGWPVLALVPGSKVPINDPELQPHGCHSATTDVAIFRELFARNPGANVGIATGPTSGVAGVDYDGLHAPALGKANGLVAPDTRTVRTPSGGWHIYITHDDAIPSKARILQADCGCTWPDGRPHPCGIDSRGRGGYVVAPPSVVDGRRYEVIRDLPIGPWPEFVELCRSLAPKPVPKSAPRIPHGDGLIARLKAAWTVEEVAERLGARLIGQGDQLKAKCPLHGEQKGFAFVVWRRDQHWRCFGRCNTGGDAIDLYRLARERGAV